MRVLPYNWKTMRQGLDTRIYQSGPVNTPSGRSFISNSSDPSMLPSGQVKNGKEITPLFSSETGSKLQKGQPPSDLNLATGGEGVLPSQSWDSWDFLAGLEPCSLPPQGLEYSHAGRAAPGRLLGKRRYLPPWGGAGNRAEGEHHRLEAELGMREQGPGDSSGLGNS